MSRGYRFHPNLTRITGILHEDPCTFMAISCSVLLGMKNVSEAIRTRCMINNFFPENRAVYEIMWRNIVERGRP